MTRVYFSLIACIVFICGCSHNVPLTISPAINIGSSYEEKIKGPVILVIDNNLRTINQGIKPSTLPCSAHSYPVIMNNILAFSIKATTEAVFDQVIEQSILPTEKEMQKIGIQGTIYVRLSRFYSTIIFSKYVMASCDIVLDLTVKDSRNENLLTTTVRGVRTASGGAGAFCGGGTAILSNAVSQSIRETMESYAERISNSDKIRRTFRTKKND